MTIENGNGATAPLKNVALAVRALERAMTRPQHLPGMVCFYGPSGFGKSVAAAYAANKHRAHYIECKSTWTKKAILTAIAREMGLVPAPTMYDLTDQISAQLVETDRPLIIDEMDHIVRREAVEIIRDIYEGSKVAILLIGEENLPNNLKKSERFHGRVLDFIPAQAADASDARVLAKFYCHKVKIADDLLSEVAKRAKGSIRRICVNLARIEEETHAAGKTETDLSEWNASGKGFWTGEAVVRGEFVR